MKRKEKVMIVDPYVKGCIDKFMEDRPDNFSISEIIETIDTDEIGDFYTEKRLQLEIGYYLRKKGMFKRSFLRYNVRYNNWYKAK